MSWQKIVVETQTESIEAISNILMTNGAEGVEIDDSAELDHYQPADATVMVKAEDIVHRTSGASVSGYFANETDLVLLTNKIQSSVDELSDFGLDAHPGTVTVQAVLEDDWATEWQKYYHPVRVTRHITVVPKWENYQPIQKDEQVIVLDPGMAFGTGTHPTTQLMIQALEVVVRGGETVIDVGTGSGVLGITARLLGAGDILGTDIDDVAVTSAQGNVDLNPQVADMQLMVSDLLNDVPNQKYDIVIANMLAEVLELLIPNVGNVLQPNGRLLLSGIYYDKRDKMIFDLQENGLVVEQSMKLGDWYGIIAKFNSEDN
ncbi:50S ribosomal protein L11 methyltransferase [Weissella hellenica]|uniref:Ribosomal protein L11 methyltransferase n=1 Tax=Weissella hellenica TaxID=46256 RepID=A0A4Y4G3M0_WEIHE|nr:50S ribosomal protein L11 methyltransferase [Weissella hellenica]NKY67061.1 50S ribosomal protein L11 methyltransferase [Weissella hellenica]GED36076.1 ribosomal protein L11 methyltransferase [Weissella hellenica]SCB95793.1 ribosomal protein L11 methyltransferase [Weissella hellenica]